MPSTVPNSAPISVTWGVPANIKGSAPATSATARRLRSPTPWILKRFTTRCAFTITPTTGLFIASLSRPRRAQVAERLLEATQRRLKHRPRRRKVEPQPGLPARPKLRTWAGKNAGAALDAVSDLIGRQARAGKIDPGKIGGSETHRACTR